MDGYHLYRKDLSQEGVRFRGAHWTFDSKRFKQDIAVLKQNKCGRFPSFDHALKDPKENDIEVRQDHKYVIVEGLYLYLKFWEMENLFDVKILVECDKDIAAARLIKRHVEAGICKNEEEAKFRAWDNDMKNGDFILQNSIVGEQTVKVKSHNQDYD